MSFHDPPRVTRAEHGSFVNGASLVTSLLNSPPRNVLYPFRHVTVQVKKAVAVRTEAADGARLVIRTGSEICASGSALSCSINSQSWL